jgi:hypothetical protein
MGLIQQGTHHGHLRVFEHRIPPCLLVLKPAPYALPVGHPCTASHMVGNMAEPWTQGKHAHARTLARPVQQRVELRTACLTDRGRDGREFLRELGDGVTETVAEPCPGDARSRCRLDGPAQSANDASGILPHHRSPDACVGTRGPGGRRAYMQHTPCRLHSGGRMWLRLANRR